MGKKDAINEFEYEQVEIKELTDDQERLSKLSKEELEVIESIEKWLITYRKYRDYDFTDDFKVKKLIPLLKFTQHGEIEFVENGIIQNLREPIEMTDKSGNTTRKITELKYRIRYQDFELDKYTRGINIEKEAMSYVRAQIALLTDTARGIVGKMSDVDSNTSKLISSLYFLG